MSPRSARRLSAPARFLLLLLCALPVAPLVAHIPQVPTVYLEIFGPAGAAGQMYMESIYLPPVTTGPWAPAWSPAGSEIVVAMQGSLWKVPAEGGEAVQITSGPHYDSEPSWSPDGRQIAFTRDTGHTIDIWVVNADGTSLRQLTHSKVFSVNPRWSPDGDTILFTSPDFGKSLGLASVSAKDETVRPMLADAHQNITPSWSPDGKEIVFISNRQWDGKRILGTGGLWKLRLGTTEPNLLLPEATVWHARPAWSPDEAKVAYISFRTGHNELWLLSVTAGNPLQLTFQGSEVFTPSWSPDSKTIAYISNAGATFTLWTIPAVGGTPSEVKISRLKYQHPTGRLQVVVRDAGNPHGDAGSGVSPGQRRQGLRSAGRVSPDGGDHERSLFSHHGDLHCGAAAGKGGRGGDERLRVSAPDETSGDCGGPDADGGVLAGAVHRHGGPGVVLGRQPPSHELRWHL